jgi:hypothetical protein
MAPIIGRKTIPGLQDSSAGGGENRERVRSLALGPVADLFCAHDRADDGGAQLSSTVTSAIEEEPTERETDDLEEEHRVDLADECHTNGLGGLCDGDADLYTWEVRNDWERADGKGEQTLKSSSRSSSSRSSPSRGSAAPYVGLPGGGGT